MTGRGSDFAAFKRAFEGGDFQRWVSFYADDAGWMEYRHSSPQRSPNRMVGKRQIAVSLGGICGVDLGITLADEVIGAGRVAFSVDCALPDGRQVFEHVTAHVRDAQVVRQVDVEAWDE